MVKIKFDINISNKALYTFVAVAIIIAIAVGVSGDVQREGIPTPANPAIFGHSADELDLTGITATSNPDNNPQIKISGNEQTFKGIEFRDTTKNTAWQISGSRPNGYGDGDFEIYYNDGDVWKRMIALKAGTEGIILPVEDVQYYYGGSTCDSSERGALRLVRFNDGSYIGDKLCICKWEGGSSYKWRCINEGSYY